MKKKKDSATLHKKTRPMTDAKKLSGFYDSLFSHYGPQKWWPGRTPFEVVVGAILTQNTNWGNVEKAIGNLKRARALNYRAMHALPTSELAELIRPSGYYNIKARRLKNFLDLVSEKFSGSLSRLFKLETGELRKTLLSINGIGPETADSILLYAAERAVFVVDAYTIRILRRHSLIDESWDYHRVQDLFTSSLAPETKLYNEYHALIVMTGKELCKTREPLCEECPLGGFL